MFRRKHRTGWSGRAMGGDVDRLEQLVNVHGEAARQMMALGRWAEAHEHNTTALAAARRLQRLEPRSPDHPPVIAAGLHNQATIADHVGEHDVALEAAEAAVDLYEELRIYDTPRYEPLLADAWARRALLLQRRGDRTARTFASLAAEAYRRLVADQPHRSRDLARVLVVGASTAWDPNGQEALDTAREALQIYRELPGPLDASDQDYFGAVALRVARAGFEAGRLDEAGDAVHDAVEQLERCADRSPNDHGGWYALALALLARHHVSRDDLVKARQAVALGAALVIALPADVKGKTEAEDALFALRADIDG